jgi:hypothetical protein
MNDHLSYIEKFLAFEMGKPSLSPVTNRASLGFRLVTKVGAVLHLGYASNPLI